MRKTSRKLAALALALCLTAGCVLLSAPKAAALAAYENFHDISADGAGNTPPWYANYLNQSLLEGFFYGVSATTFEPERSITRGEAVTVLGRVHERLNSQLILAAVEDPYLDVKSTRYYGKYAAWAKENGLTSGGATLEPAAVIDQPELADLMNRYLTAVLDGDIPMQAAADSELARLQVLWADPAQRADLTERKYDAVYGKETYGLCSNLGVFGTRWDDTATVPRGDCAAFFVELYQTLTFPAADEETPRLRFAYTAPKTGPVPEEDEGEDGEETEPAQTWTYFSVTGIQENKSEKLQRGFRVIENDGEYQEFLALLGRLNPYNGQGADNDAPALTVDGDFFTDHDLLAVELSVVGKSQAAGFIPILTGFELGAEPVAQADGETGEIVTRNVGFATVGVTLLGYAQTYGQAQGDGEDQVFGTVYCFAIDKGMKIGSVTVDAKAAVEEGQAVGVTTTIR